MILNAGIIHHVGPNRLHVLLARSLADAGHEVLRFDLSGIGDSFAHPGNLDLRQGVLDDCWHAAELLAQRGAERIIVFGLCSGANNGFLFTVADPRVAGLVAIDPTVPLTHRYWVGWLARRAGRRTAWRKLLLGRKAPFEPLIRWWSARRREVPRTDGADRSGRSAEMLQAIIDRGVHLYFVFTGENERYNYRDQLFDAYRGVTFGSRVTLNYLQRASHTFAHERDRSALIGAVTVWMSKVGDRELLHRPATRDGTARG